MHINMYTFLYIHIRIHIYAYVRVYAGPEAGRSDLEALLQPLEFALNAELEGQVCCVAVCCSILQCVAVCCSVLQCVAVR